MKSALHHLIRIKDHAIRVKAIESLHEGGENVKVESLHRAWAFVDSVKYGPSYYRDWQSTSKKSTIISDPNDEQESIEAE